MRERRSAGAIHTIAPACVSSHLSRASQPISAAAADDDDEDEDEDEDVVEYCYLQNISVYWCWLQDVRHCPQLRRLAVLDAFCPLIPEQCTADYIITTSIIIIIIIIDIVPALFRHHYFDNCSPYVFCAQHE